MATSKDVRIFKNLDKKGGGAPPAMRLTIDSQTTVPQLLKQGVSTFNLGAEDKFDFFIVTKEGARVVQPEEKILDLVSSFDYEVKLAVDVKGKEKLVDQQVMAAWCNDHWTLQNRDSAIPY